MRITSQHAEVMTHLQDKDEEESVLKLRTQEVAECVQRQSGAKLVDRLESHLHFKVPTESERRLSTLFAYIKV